MEKTAQSGTSRSHFLCILLISSASFSFLLSSLWTIPGWRKIEAILFEIVIAGAIVLSHYKRETIRWKEGWTWFVAAFVIFLAIVKNIFFWCPVPLYTAVSFSFIFSMGQAFQVMAVLELYADRNSITNFLVFSFFVIIASSYSLFTWALVPCMILYAVVWIMLARARHPRVIGTYPSSTTIYAGICIVLALCLSGSLVLVKYRERLNDWNPLQFSNDDKPSPSPIVGFSNLSVLGSKNIMDSREAVLRIYATPQSCYLRGKVFDLYKEGRWELSDPSQTILRQENRTFPDSLNKRIHPSNGSLPDDLPFLMPGVSSISEDDKAFRLIFLSQECNILFAPIHCKAVYLSRSFSLFINLHGILQVSPTLPDSVFVIVARRDIPSSSEDASCDFTRYLSISEELRPFFVALSQKIMDDSSGYMGQNRSGEVDVVMAQANAIQDYLGKNFPYTTNTVLEKGKDPIVSFLTRKNGGHCEMFASSFVMLARSLRIPCRYVTGYYAHEWNRLGKFLTVRSCDAHAWVEMYLPQKGWITIDPTPQIPLWQVLENRRGFAEEYIELLSEWFRAMWQWVKAFMAARKWSDFAIVFLVLLGTFLLIRRSLQIVRARIKLHKLQRLQSSEPLLREMLSRFLQQNAKTFRKRYSHETGREYFASMLNDAPEDMRTLGKEILTIWEAEIYGDRKPSKARVENLYRSFTSE